MLPLTIYTQQTPDHTKTISPPHLEVDFLIDSGTTLNILNNDTWNAIKGYHKLPLKASIFVLSAAKNSTLKSIGTVKFTLSRNLTKNRSLRNTSFTPTFHVSNTKLNVLRTLFLEKYIDLIKYSSHSLEIKNKHELKSLNFYDSSINSPPYFSRLFTAFGDQILYFQPFEHRILTYSLIAYECKSK